MNDTIVVNVSIGQHWQRGGTRLAGLLDSIGQPHRVQHHLPDGCPSHQKLNYAFKAHAIAAAAKAGHRRIMWLDSSMVPGPAAMEGGRPLGRIWDWAAEHGAWASANGNFTNYEWTADSAYPDLFPECRGREQEGDQALIMNLARCVNRGIPHLSSGAFAFDLDHHKGAAAFGEFCHLGMNTRAFHGPWWNLNCPQSRHHDPRKSGICGPSDVQGHRHDQSSLSVVMWRLGIPISDTADGPNLFAYPGGVTEETVLIADGEYV